ncbi:hypothetical protein KY495_02390 [Massilia sp. PAMC28688]|uniref:hypothetical protein n=1 Tax=Massilia sp. PAMC28688 TaxID=2861283 RepID=UPI001C6328BA|nr:hypothetical protein [Massilia sp. PAMC28688]QYF96240.1 hypothetical protein KY495_02390 [Massilia sp. PAMC28688]
MNASKLFTAIAALVFAGSAAAADTPVATTAVTTAAVAAAAQAVAIAQPAGNSREQVRAEAISAAKQRRATEAGQADWFMK